MLVLAGEAQVALGLAVVPEGVGLAVPGRTEIVGCLRKVCGGGYRAVALYLWNIALCESLYRMYWFIERAMSASEAPRHVW